jgi:hypothetical protein
MGRPVPARTHRPDRNEAARIGSLRLSAYLLLLEGFVVA